VEASRGPVISNSLYQQAAPCAQKGQRRFLTAETRSLQQTKADQKPIEEVKAKAQAGDAESEVELGLRYLDGKDVPKNQVEAVKWFRKAAEQNFAAAQNRLGVCYGNGEGVAKDQVEAIKWYRKAAKQNLAAAQYNLGMCYHNGEGVAKDWVEAYKWLLLATRQGDEDAKKNITELTPEQIAQGQKLARDFMPR
jgi:TPR repeat protein